MRKINLCNGIFEEKSTLCGREFDTFTTLSVKKFFRTAFVQRG